MQNRKRDTDVQNRLWDSVGKARVGCSERIALKQVLSRVEQIASPAWMHETSAQDWCTGKTQREGMGREVGRVLGWGTHVNPWLIHVIVWQKPLQYCKVISLQLIKIHWWGKKKSDVICIYEVIDISPSNLDSSLCFFQPNVSHDVLCI